MPVRSSFNSRFLSAYCGYSNDFQVTWNYETIRKTLTWLDNRITSANVVGWKEKMADGQNVSTTLFGNRYLARAGVGRGYQQSIRFSDGRVGYATNAVGDMLFHQTANPTSLTLAGPSVLERARSQAEINFSKSFKRKTSQWETGVFAGELMEAVRMLASPARALRSGVDDLYKTLRSKQRRLKGKKLRDAIAGSYLEWKFGIQPFINDADSAATAFRAMASGRTFDIIRVLGIGEASEVITSVSPYQGPGVGWLNNPSVLATFVDEYWVEVSLRGAWRNKSPSGQMPIPMIFSTGLGDVVPTAWELVPWSFFVDYFTNIGDVLGAWSMRFQEFAWINETVRYRTTRTISIPAGTAIYKPFPTADTVLTNVTCAPARIVRMSTTRAPYDNSWAPTPLVKIPGIGDTSKWLNIAALLSMRVRP